MGFVLSNLSHVICGRDQRFYFVDPFCQLGDHICLPAYPYPIHSSIPVTDQSLVSLPSHSRRTPEANHNYKCRSRVGDRYVCQNSDHMTQKGYHLSASTYAKEFTRFQMQNNSSAHVSGIYTMKKTLTKCNIFSGNLELLC